MPFEFPPSTKYAGWRPPLSSTQFYLSPQQLNGELRWEKIVTGYWKIFVHIENKHFSVKVWDYPENVTEVAVPRFLHFEDFGDTCLWCSPRQTKWQEGNWRRPPFPEQQMEPREGSEERSWKWSRWGEFWLDGKGCRSLAAPQSAEALKPTGLHTSLADVSSKASDAQPFCQCFVNDEQLALCCSAGLCFIELAKVATFLWFSPQHCSQKQSSLLCLNTPLATKQLNEHVAFTNHSIY